MRFPPPGQLTRGVTLCVLVGGCLFAADPALSRERSPAGARLRAVTTASETGGTKGGPASPGEGAPAPAPSPNPCKELALGLHCPDLIMSAPSEIHLDRTSMPGHVLLRATSSVNNRGSGPLELRARRPARRRWAVYQVIYDRRGRRHVAPTRLQLTFKFVPGDRYGYGYVGAASYWKVRDVAVFQLWSVGPHLLARALVRTGPKLDYCLRDLSRTAPSRRSPLEPIYSACTQEPGIMRDVLGTSVGWSDVYPYGYPEQWVDVTGLRGVFAFVMRADPAGLFIEANHANNVSETFVTLPSGRVLGHRVGVASP